MGKKTIAQIDVKSRRVLTRVDFNVPLDEHGTITDDRRIRMALPTINSVRERAGRLILISHLGRPRGRGPEPELSLKPVAERLRDILPDAEVEFVPDDCVGEEAQAAVEKLEDGQILLLENLRFHEEEKTGDETFARRLASYGDIYCNDAFGTAHREDASMVAVPGAMEGKPRVAGLLLARELEYLSEAIERGSSSGGFAAVLGGAKVSDKLGAIRNLLDRVDRILIGGAMAYTFLEALGRKVGNSRVEKERLDDARRIMAEAAENGVRIDLPIDHVCGAQPAEGTPVKIFSGDIEDGWMGLDIGAETASAYSRAVREAKTIVWNGPLGMFEVPPFDAGTRKVASAIAAATSDGAISIIGGGDSAAAIEEFGLADQVSHVSTGGGASLRMLEGRPFRSVELLDDA
jgi:phosphoglycerate kinase